jgi:methyl-accepting chemotaxis protein
MKNGHKTTQRVVEETKQTDSVLEAIAKGVLELIHINESMAVASQAQSDASMDVSTRAVKQTADASTTIDAVASQLSSLVGRFRTNSSGLESTTQVMSRTLVRRIVCAAQTQPHDSISIHRIAID